MNEHHAYWDNFYASRQSSAVPDQPSGFAGWVADRLQPGQTVAEFGFGTGRDALWFARRGHPVRGFDFAESAVDRTTAHATTESLDAQFDVLDLYDFEATARVASDLVASGPVALYGRFLIHSLEDGGRSNLLDLSQTVLQEAGALFLEFRTGLDRDSRHVFGDDHYRQYLDPDQVENEIRSRGGIIVSSQAGYGLSVYKSEDPHVARIEATWTDR